MSTIITDRNLIAILKGANALAAQIVARHPELFAEQPQQPTPPVADTPVLTRAIIEARLAENPRTECADCGCEEGCVSYLHDLLHDLDVADEGTAR